MDVTIKSDTAGAHDEITIEKTGADKGTVRVRHWNAGLDPATSHPTKDTVTHLDSIQAGDGGAKIVCHAAMIFHPTVTFTIAKAPAPASVRVAVPSIGKTDDYPVTAADRDNLLAFFVAANFPALPG